MIKHDIVVIGGGPAGMAAAVAAFDKGVKDVIIIDRENVLGGILMQCIHNGFGLHKLGKELTGPEYAAVYAQKVNDRKIKVYTQTTVIDINKDHIVTIQNKEGIIKINAGAIILSMGCRERSKGALNISGSRPAGIYSAGTAQKLINCFGLAIGKKVLILGSGDIGLIMARRLTLEGAKVEAVCEIMPYSGGLKRNIVQCLDDFNIPLYLSTTVTEIHGNDRVSGVSIAKVDAQRNIIKSTEQYIQCDTLLLSVGLIPENELTKKCGIKLNSITGGSEVDENRQTSINGIFACGNVLQVHDLVDYVSDEAEIAGKSAAEHIMTNSKCDTTVDVLNGFGVKYVLPQKVHINTKSDISFYFRVSNPFDKVKYIIKSGDMVLATSNRIKATPGEMEKITVKSEHFQQLNQDIVVYLEEL